MPQKILIVDDDPDFSEAAASTLRASGFTVLIAHHGKEGIVKAREESPDLVLLDVMMKKKTEGFDVARKLKSDPATQHIPVIMITGIRRELNLPFGFEVDDEWLPAKAVLEKPVHPQVLLRAIEETLK
jgi:CheY-like chemotaxis protein